MSIFFQSFRKFSSLELRILLCFLLPPLGIFLLLLTGLHTFLKQWKENKRFVFSLSSFFFLCLFISTIGAAISMNEISYLSISLMILGYWGLYLRILETEKNQLFQHFRLIMIFGGVYSCVIGWISKWYTFPPAISYLTGTVLFGQSDLKDYNRLIGCGYNPNFTVYILLIAISFILAYLLASLRSNRFVSLMWQLPILLLLSYGVIQTGSRAGFASMILIYLIFILRLNRTIFIISTIFSLSLSKWLLHFLPRNESVFQSIQVRHDIWKNGYKIWKDHAFFGVTPIGFGKEYLKHYNEFIPHAHNMLIGMFAEYGTLGGLALLFLICLNLMKCIHLFFPIRSKKCLLDSFLLGLPIIILTGVFDEPLFSPQIGFLTVILLACWDRYTKRIHFVMVFPSISRIKYWIYLHVKAPKNQT
ncbi:O-antigen ligase family protein [Bacillus methanolicus]|nr:O-antigen ligase family protein [Bacillus methanolicus]